jgi:hypothetical protein
MLCTANDIDTRKTRTTFSMTPLSTPIPLFSRKSSLELVFDDHVKANNSIRSWLAFTTVPNLPPKNS